MFIGLIMLFSKFGAKLQKKSDIRKFFSKKMQKKYILQSLCYKMKIYRKKLFENLQDSKKCVFYNIRVRAHKKTCRLSQADMPSKPIKPL